MKNKDLVILILASGGLLGVSAGAQQSSAPQQGAYEGVSQPPQDTIETSPDAPPPPPVKAKPSAAVLATDTSAPPAGDPVGSPDSAPPLRQRPAELRDSTRYPNSTAPVAGEERNYQQADGTDAGIVRPAFSDPGTPARDLRERLRQSEADPDHGIAQLRAARPGELLEGSTIRVKLENRISSTASEQGEPFTGRVTIDVMQDGRVMIPAGSAIEGRVSAVSSGHFAGHGSLRLRPETVVLPDGTRFALHAETTGTQGSHTRMGAEGAINPGSRKGKDSIEYGATMGAGAVTGAVLGGPVGALTGTIVGAGLVTTHLMVDHPQATLEPGSIVLFSLTEPMNLTPAGS